MSDASDTQALVPAARLFGRLLVRELDAATATELQEPAVRAALATLRVQLPPAWDLDELAAEYCEALLRPAHGRPPVQSLWTEGQYDGEPAVALRRVAAAAALELAPGARGAAVDHIGCVLLLWAEVAAVRPELAERLRREHLAWALAPLRAAATGGGFYAQVAGAAARCITEIVGDQGRAGGGT